LPGKYAETFADFGIFDVGGGQYGGVFVRPGDTRGKMWQTLQVKRMGDATQIQVKNARAAFTRGSDDAHVFLKKIIKIAFDGTSFDRKRGIVSVAGILAIIVVPVGGET